MGHLDELHAKYKDRGLSVIALTNEPRGLVDKFVADTGAKHPVVIEEGDSIKSFAGKGFPTIVLIGADGRVLANGGISDAQIEEALKEVEIAPKLPAKLAAAQALLDKRKYGEARAALEKAGAVESAPEEERKAAQDAVAWLDETAKQRLDRASVKATQGDAVAAAEIYERTIAEYKGAEPAAAAAAALKELTSDPAKKKEIDGAKAWADLQEKIADMKPKKALPLLRSFVSKYEGTKAGEEGRKILQRYESM